MYPLLSKTDTKYISQRNDLCPFNFSCRLYPSDNFSSVSSFEQSIAAETNFPPLSHLIRKHIYSGMSAFRDLLLRMASLAISLSLSVSICTLNVCVCVCLCTCRCYGKLCAPWYCHDWSDETLFIYDSLYFQLHWTFLFQGEYIVTFYCSHSPYDFSTVMSSALPG